MIQPKVSVAITTYNHSVYISTAIESVLDQITSFNYEILIGIDESSDGTKEICEKYLKANPNKIRLFHRNKKDVIYINGHPIGRSNGLKTIEAANGKYVALLDGDDYWTDPYKLQKQVDALESNPDCIACHTWQKLGVYDENTKVYSEKEAPKDDHGYYPLTKAGGKEIFENKLRIKTRTLLFRKDFERNEEFFPKWYLKVRYGDVPLMMFLARYGNFYFIDEEMAVYRQTTTGVSTAGKQNKNWALNHYWAWIDIWCYADKMYEKKYHKEATNTIREFYSKIISSYNNSKKQRIKLAIKVLFQLKQSLNRRIKDCYFCLTYKNT